MNGRAGNDRSVMLVNGLIGVLAVLAWAARRPAGSVTLAGDLAMIVQPRFTLLDPDGLPDALRPCVESIAVRQFADARGDGPGIPLLIDLAQLRADLATHVPPRQWLNDPGAACDARRRCRMSDGMVLAGRVIDLRLPIPVGVAGAAPLVDSAIWQPPPGRMPPDGLQFTDDAPSGVQDQLVPLGDGRVLVRRIVAGGNAAGQALSPAVNAGFMPQADRTSLIDREGVLIAGVPYCCRLLPGQAALLARMFDPAPASPQTLPLR
ncbi:hypothetical protein ACPVPU_05045 [Sphingomonas sp. CJ99]